MHLGRTGSLYQDIRLPSILYEYKCLGSYELYESWVQIPWLVPCGHRKVCCFIRHDFLVVVERTPSTPLLVPVLYM